MSRLATLYSALFLFAGCTEVDGPMLGTSNEAARICPGGALKRKAVQPNILDAFNTCCDGSAHWIPEHVVPAEFRSMLERNDQDKTLCIPDDIATDPIYTPRKCTSLFGQPGACISSCVRDVAKAPIALPKDVCPGNELCAPCIDPRTRQETGSCQLGMLSCEKQNKGPCTDYQPTFDVSGFPECCNDGPAHCAPDALVPTAQKKDLDGCNSSSGAGYCVPDKFLRRGGAYTPKKCKSVGGREGRCLSVCVKSVKKDAHSLPQDVCDADERCAPCYDPRTGFGTGACSSGFCETGPTEPPRKFDSCGPAAAPDHALCVPGESVPIEERCNFDAKGCGVTPCKNQGEICVPKKVIEAGPAFEPKVCYNDLTGFLGMFKTLFKEPFKILQAMADYREGRCLSRCLAEVRDKADLLGQGTCDEHEVCVPCYDPQKMEEGKVPTGACHRPSCPVPPTP